MPQISEAQPSKMIGKFTTIFNDGYKLETEVYEHSDTDAITAAHSRIHEQYHSHKEIVSQEIVPHG